MAPKSRITNEDDLRDFCKKSLDLTFKAIVCPYLMCAADAINDARIIMSIKWLYQTLREIDSLRYQIEQFRKREEDLKRRYSGQV